ncbi:flagellar export chaperone FlgN [Buchnera aphidicola]|uniref:flagellar export chaperone FlgN n=1 Tax=Buchnera aphidicola TaxID=9 RepID=UPI003BEEBA50
MQEKRLCLEKEKNFFSPYVTNNELNTIWNKISDTCLILKEINLKNKKILNQKFYINQNFLEIASTYSNNIIYDDKGNLKF